MASEKQLILSICIPTYNRSAVLLQDVKRYFSINDTRFCVRVYDNASSDGTCEKLSNIKDNRLFIYKNENNIGGPANVMKSLQCADSEYVLLVLDKDAVSIEYLSAFIDTIEQFKPQWGMVNLSAKEPEAPAIISHGIDAIRNSSTYAPRHPSGFFVKSSLYNHFLATDWSKIETEKCKFPLELYQLYLALNYDMLMVNVPLIITEKKEICQKVKSNTYTESNCWFLYEARKTYYQVFLTRIMESIDDTKLKRTIIEEMTKVALRNVSVVMRSWLLDNAICMHYYVKSRYVTAFEMTKNMHGIIQEYKKYTAHTPAFSFNLYIKLYGLIIKCFVKYSIKDIVKYHKK